jgi:hypothetical protein
MKKILFPFFIAFLLVSGAHAQLTESFEALTFPPGGWLNNHTIGSDGTAVWERETTGAFGGDLGAGIFTVDPHSGTGMAEFRSYDFSSGNGANLITGVVNLSSGGPFLIKFWMYRDITYTNSDSISVYVNTAANTTGASFLGKIIRQKSQAPVETGPDGWYQYSFSIPAGYNTATNYFIFSAVGRFGNNMFIDDISVEPNTACSGTPLGGTATANPGTLCSTGNSTISLSGASTSTGITYQWQSSPAGANTFADIPSANANSYAATGVAASTDYKCKVTCTNGGAFVFSTIATVNLSGIPANDDVCNAINLTVGGAPDCKNTTCATSVGDPALPGGCSSPNNTVWYKYTPLANGIANVRLTNNTATGGLNGWLAWYTATGTCPTLTLAPVTGSDCQPFGQTGNFADTLVSVSLTAGTTYYLMLDGFSGAFGSFCINLVAPPAAPGCITNVSPENGATGVVIIPNTPITWNAAATATSYDVYFGTVNPPTTLIGNISAPAVSANITGLVYDSTYYWFIVPKNTGGGATGCNSNTTSFVAQPAPPNCIPITGSGCTLSDRINLFRLKGETTELNINTGTACSANGYVDSTDHPVVIDLARSKSYWGQVIAGTAGDYLTLWLDANNNGLWENGERLLNNLPLTGTTTDNFNLYIPSTIATGNHRLRARLVWYSAPPTSPTNACSNYTYSDTRDYLVNIVGTGNAYTVSTYTPDGINCNVSAGNITIGPLSNNNPALPVYLVDSLNKVIAAVYPDGNDLGVVSTSYYKHNAAVRQGSNGTYYLDRNITVSVTNQPLTPYRFRAFYLNTELNALIAQPGSGVSSQFDLNSTKSGGNCSSVVNVAGTILAPGGFGSISGDGFLDFSGLTSFSSFYFHGGTTYTFNGNGNWSDAANWSGGNIPPLTLTAPNIIIINPVPGGECIVNVVNQHVSPGAQFIINPNAKIRLLNNLNIQ